jgi:hypothetical protein
MSPRERLGVHDFSGEVMGTTIRPRALGILVFGIFLGQTDSSEAGILHFCARAWAAFAGRPANTSLIPGSALATAYSHIPRDVGYPHRWEDAFLNADFHLYEHPSAEGGRQNFWKAAIRDTSAHELARPAEGAPAELQGFRFTTEPRGLVFTREGAARIQTFNNGGETGSLVTDMTPAQTMRWIDSLYRNIVGSTLKIGGSLKDLRAGLRDSFEVRTESRPPLGRIQVVREKSTGQVMYGVQDLGNGLHQIVLASPTGMYRVGREHGAQDVPALAITVRDRESGDPELWSFGPLTRRSATVAREGAATREHDPWHWVATAFPRDPEITRLVSDRRQQDREIETARFVLANDRMAMRIAAAGGLAGMVGTGLFGAHLMALGRAGMPWLSTVGHGVITVGSLLGGVGGGTAGHWLASTYGQWRGSLLEREGRILPLNTLPSGMLGPEERTAWENRQKTAQDRMRTLDGQIAQRVRLTDTAAGVSRSVHYQPHAHALEVFWREHRTQMDNPEQQHVMSVLMQAEEMNLTSPQMTALVAAMSGQLTPRPGHRSEYHRAGDAGRAYLARLAPADPNETVRWP